jgi:glycosyltransferase involved in cell wall biosynthesis
MDYGGVETLLMSIYRCIDRNRIQFDFLCMNTCENAFSEEIKNLGGRMYAIPFISKVGYSGYKKRLVKFFLEHKEYTIIHTHINSYNGVVLEAAQLANIPVRIAHAHVSHAIEKNIIKKFIKEYSKGKIVKCATDFFACSEDAKNDFYSTVNEHRNCKIINNAIDTEKFRFNDEVRNSIREKYNVKEALIIGHVGRFDETKNQIMVVKVFEQYLKRGNDAVLWLIGDGYNRKQIEKYVTESGMDSKVFFWGLQKDIPSLMSTMDVFLFPSRYEGFGIVAIEAQANGLPVIASDRIPKSTEVTDLIAYVSLDDTDRWVLELQRVAEISINRMMYADIVRNAGFDIKDIAIRLQDFYLARMRDNSYTQF